MVWVGGVRVNPLIENLQVEKTSNGLLKLTPTLQIPGHDNVFALGDNAYFEDADAPPAGTAQLANQQSVLAAQNICALLAGEELQTKHFEEIGEAISLGTERCRSINRWKSLCRSPGAPGAFRSLHFTLAHLAAPLARRRQLVFSRNRRHGRCCRWGFGGHRFVPSEAHTVVPLSNPTMVPFPPEIAMQLIPTIPVDIVVTTPKGEAVLLVEVKRRAFDQATRDQLANYAEFGRS